MSVRDLRALWEPLARMLRLSGEEGPELRWVVVDVETTGLDVERDSLLSIGAVAMSHQGIDLRDSMEIAVRPPSVSDRSNILVHRIGAGAQAAGEPPAQACRRFLDFAGESPIVGYHLGFDRAFLTRAMHASGLAAPRRWLDLAELAPALRPEAQAHALDEWLALANLRAAARHSAASDAMATAMLFQWLINIVPSGERTFRRLRALARNARWAGPANR